MYLDNNNLFYQIRISQARGRLTRLAEKYLILLAQKTNKKNKFFGDKDLENDVLQGGILTLFTKWMNFDGDISENAFAYFTEVFKRGASENFNNFIRKRGDKDRSVRVYRIDTMNDGNGMFGI